MFYLGISWYWGGDGWKRKCTLITDNIPYSNWQRETVIPGWGIYSSFLPIVGIKHHDPKHLGEESPHLAYSCTPLWRQVQAATQGRNLEVETEAEAMEKRCFTGLLPVTNSAFCFFVCFVSCVCLFFNVRVLFFLFHTTENQLPKCGTAPS